MNINKCDTCKYKDEYGICQKIVDIFGYELIVDNGCLFNDNFSFEEYEE